MMALGKDRRSAHGSRRPGAASRSRAPRPPRMVERLLSWVLGSGAHSRAALGDLAEGYAVYRRRSGGLRANLWYARQTLSLSVRAGRWPRGVGAAAGADVLATTLRGIRRRPAFTLAVVGVLGAAIAATTAAFSVASGTFAAARWWADEARTVLVWPEHRFSRGQLEMLRAELALFESVGGLLRQPVVVDLDDGSAGTTGVALSPELFEALHAKPSVGRGLGGGDAEPGAEPVVVLGHGLWLRAFGGDPAVIGRVVEVSGVFRRVVGVMPPGADQPGPGAEVWTPLALDPRDPDFWPARELEVAGIVRPGTSVTEARDDVRRVLGDMARRFSFFFRPDFGSNATVVPSADRQWALVATPLLLLLAGTGLLLLVAAIDVGNLVAGRSLERRMEMRVRMALGASRTRLAVQLLAEAGVQAALAGALGWAVAVAIARRVPELFPFGTGVVETSALDPRLIGFVAAVTALSWLLVAGIPIAHFAGSTRSTVAPRRPRDSGARWLVVTQAALATTLLVTAALLLRTVQSLQALPLGFEPAGAVAVPVAPPSAPLSPAQLELVRSGVADRIVAEPGIAAAGWISAVPLMDVVLTFPVNPADAPTEVGKATTAASFVADAGALDALGVELARGRGFAPGDDGRGTPVALVNEALARALWPDRDPIGQRIAVDPHDWTRWITVIGVVRDVRYADLSFLVQPAFFLPRGQSSPEMMRLVVRVTAGAAAVVPAVRRTFAELGPGMPVGQPRGLESVVRDAQGPARVLTTLLGVLALFATALGALGLYGALAGWVLRRRTELGTRLALGAEPRRLSLAVLSTGVGLTAAGVLAGCAGAAVAGRLIRNLLFGVSPLDAPAFVVPALLLLAVAVVAAAVPALRAAAVAPAQALRDA